MKCPKCRLEMSVRSGNAEKIDDNVYWVQIFTCNNFNEGCNGKDMLKVKTNVLNPSEVITEEI